MAKVLLLFNLDLILSQNKTMATACALMLSRGLTLLLLLNMPPNLPASLPPQPLVLGPAVPGECTAPPPR